MAKDVSLTEFNKRFSTEVKCRRFMESVLWKNGRFCPHCGSLNSWPIKGLSTQKRLGLYECKACYKQFTVSV